MLNDASERQPIATREAWEIRVLKNPKNPQESEWYPFDMDDDESPMEYASFHEAVEMANKFRSDDGDPCNEDQIVIVKSVVTYYPFPKGNKK